MTVQRFAFPTAIHFGPGASRGVGSHLVELGKRRPLVVTDRALARLPIARALVASLESEGLEVAVFDGVLGNPMASQANAGGVAFREHRADAVVGFGGGAAVDVAKIVGVLGTAGGDALEYAYDHPGVRAIPDEVPYFVALPTTAGTGSEVGRSSVISEDDTHIKRIVFSPKILAKAVFADPELTLDLPAPITAATGMDALTHNVESYLSPAYHPLCDGIAVEGVRIAARALPAAVANGRDLAARSGMLMASIMGAIAFQKDLGAVHSCAHALSTVADLHHGLANGIMIDHVMRFNLDAATDKMAELARVAGVPGGDSGSAEARAQAFVAWLTELKRRLGIPATLSDYRGARAVTRDDIQALVKVAEKDLCHQTNPRPCTRSRRCSPRLRGAVRRGTMSAAGPPQGTRTALLWGERREAPLGGEHDECRRAAPRHSPPFGGNGAKPRSGGNMRAPVRIGISASFFHADATRPIFKGMTLQYIEQNVAHWLMQRDALALMIPSPDGSTRRAGSKVTLDAYAEALDALVLMGGSDVCPESYGEKALRPEWNGDRIRDDYEIGLLKAFVGRGKPVLGICRGAQIVNVAIGRHAMAGPRNAGPPCAQPPRLGDLRAELPRDHARARQRPGADVPRAFDSQDELDSPPGDQGPRPQPRRRGLVGARPDRRSDPLDRTFVSVRRAVAPGVPSARRYLVHRRHADARRFPRHDGAAQGGGVRAVASRLSRNLCDPLGEKRAQARDLGAQAGEFRVPHREPRLQPRVPDPDRRAGDAVQIAARDRRAFPPKTGRTAKPADTVDFSLRPREPA